MVSYQMFERGGSCATVRRSEQSLSNRWQLTNVLAREYSSFRFKSVALRKVVLVLARHG